MSDPMFDELLAAAREYREFAETHGMDTFLDLARDRLDRAIARASGQRVAAIAASAEEVAPEGPWGSLPGDEKDPNYGRACGRCFAPIRAGGRYAHECPPGSPRPADVEIGIEATKRATRAIRQDGIAAMVARSRELGFVSPLDHAQAPFGSEEWAQYHLATCLDVPCMACGRARQKLGVAAIAITPPGASTEEPDGS